MPLTGRYTASASAAPLKPIWTQIGAQAVAAGQVAECRRLLTESFARRKAVATATAHMLCLQAPRAAAGGEGVRWSEWEMAGGGASVRRSGAAQERVGLDGSGL